MHYLFHHPEIELTNCIFHAAKSWNYKAMELFIKKGASLDTQLDNGRTVLHSAVEMVNKYGFGMHGIVRLLIRAGADMLHRDNAGNTPLDIQSRLYTCFVHRSLSFVTSKNLFENRRLYLSGKLGPEDTIDSVFQVASDFLDIPVLESIKDQLGDRLARRRPSGENLLMLALWAGDLEGVNWLLDRKTCNVTEVDGKKHDALWFALKTTSFQCNIRQLAVVNRLLEGGSRLTAAEDHLLEAASIGRRQLDDLLSPGNIDDTFVRLLITYRYSLRPENERLSLFK